MLAGGYKYTIGNYNESPEGTLSTSGVALLASTLSWAAKNNIPFHHALISLTETGSAVSTGVGLNREIISLFPNSRNWNKCLVFASRDLMAGKPLYVTLRKRLGYFIPEYYLEAVEMAEKAGNLPEVLPHFAKRLNLSAKIRTSYRAAVSGPFIEFAVLALLLLFMSTFVFPNWKRIFDELLAGELIPATMLFNFSMHNLFRNWSDEGVTLLVLGIPALFICYRLFRRYILMYFEEILIHMPYFRLQLKDLATLELAASIASYLSAGEDILSATKFSQKACRHLWLKRRLKRFIDDLEKGGNWLDAWRRMNLNQPLNEAILRNADARENIIDGFDTMTDWLYHRTISDTRKNAVWFYILFFAVNAAIVFFIAYAIFASLIMIIEKIV